jgi:hypothetical protein
MRQQQVKKCEYSRWKLKAALEHIRRRGSLAGFRATREERLILLTCAIEQELVNWNMVGGKYQLTPSGRLHIMLHEKVSAKASG